MIKTFGEWHKQSALFVALPHENTDWKAYLDEISLSYRKFIFFNPTDSAVFQ